ncbi:MAG: TonB C-terminal domain-containing protein [Bryobacterales bacterium]|nr:TonB C-terminal domain-containing protein [Bryobacterales bacterium]
MPRQTDILDEREPLRQPFAGSILLHAAVFSGIALSGLITARSRESWGDPNSLGGGVVGITAVRQIPLLATQGPRNPVANDTESQVPAPPPKPVAKTAAKEDPDAISLKSKSKKSRPQPVRYDERKMPKRDYSDNQLTSRVGQAASSQMYGMTPGSGGVGVGTGAPFGTRFGAYAGIVRDRVAQKWRTDEVDPRMNSAPPVVVVFEIARDGSVRGVRVAQSSSLMALDNSARRAIIEAGPFPPLPAQYDGNSATIEFWFQLKR